MYTILVVDDSPFIVDVFVTMLERGGYRTVAAYGGEECLEILKTVTPDLILLDIMMEPVDGWETLERIKENPDTKEIPVLMLTAKQLTPAEAQEYGIYIEDYVLKPITHRELYDAIEHVLTRRQSIKSDMDMAKQSGFDTEVITEYARLSKSIDVNKRLMKILETTYNFNDSKVRVSDEISRAIKSMEMNIKFQENRLQQIKGETIRHSRIPIIFHNGIFPSESMSEYHAGEMHPVIVLQDTMTVLQYGHRSKAR